MKSTTTPAAPAIPPKDTRDARIAALTADRDYLWNALAELEAWASTAPRAEVARTMRDRLATVLDSFKPTVRTERVMP